MPPPKPPRQGSPATAPRKAAPAATGGAPPAWRRSAWRALRGAWARRVRAPAVRCRDRVRRWYRRLRPDRSESDPWSWIGPFAYLPDHVDIRHVFVIARAIAPASLGKALAHVKGARGAVGLEHPEVEPTRPRLGIIEQRAGQPLAAGAGMDVERVDMRTVARDEPRRAARVMSDTHPTARDHLEHEGKVAALAAHDRQPRRGAGERPKDRQKPGRMEDMGARKGHSLSPKRNCAARSSRIWGGPSPGFRVRRAGAKFIT